jgi:hypothetical protein
LKVRFSSSKLPIPRKSSIAIPPFTVIKAEAVNRGTTPACKSSAHVTGDAM